MAGEHFTKKYYAKLLNPVRAAVAKHGGDIENDDVVNASTEALHDQPLLAVFGAIREAAEEPGAVRALCDAALARVEFFSEDLSTIATALGYHRPERNGIFGA